MKYIGHKIYYIKLTGEVIQRTSQKEGKWARQSSEGEDITGYTALSERNRDTFDVLELPFGAYQQDFAESNGYRVNVETKTLEFSYPDPNEPEVEQPYQAPMSEEIAELRLQNDMLQSSVMEMTMYAASQDERLTTQENALLEVSMLMMGGM